MDFSRRIGELWEPFCKLVFKYSSNNLIEEEVLSFEKLKEKIKLDTLSLIENNRSEFEKINELKEIIEKTWSIIDSMAVQLELDLHIRYEDIKYNIDFKSGFNSNEKGNTNRLLMVAKIYNNFIANSKCILLCRTEEDRNNNYLQTIKNLMNGKFIVVKKHIQK